MKKNEADLCYFSSELLLEAKNLPWDKNMYKRTKSYAVSNGITVMNQLVKNNEYTCSNCMLMTKLSLIQDNNIQYTEGYIYEDNYLNGDISFRAALNNMDFAFDVLRLESLYGYVLKENRRARRFNSALGYTVAPNQEDESIQLYRVSKDQYYIAREKIRSIL